MKILHEDGDGYLLVLMEPSEFRRATGVSPGMARVGNEADVLDLMVVESRLKNARDALLKVYPPEVKSNEPAR